RLPAHGRERHQAGVGDVLVDAAVWLAQPAGRRHRRADGHADLDGGCRPRSRRHRTGSELPRLRAALPGHFDVQSYRPVDDAGRHAADVIDIKAFTKELNDRLKSIDSYLGSLIL